MFFDNFKAILSRLPEEVELMVVSKYAQASELNELLSSGLVSHIGESRVQEAERKLASLNPRSARIPRWHLIGNLQKNKAKKAIRLFDWVDSLDDPETAKTLEYLAAGKGEVLPVLVQVNLSDNAAQHGIPSGQMEEFLAALKKFPHLQARGLMGIAPFLDPVERVRPYFRKMRELFRQHFHPEKLDFKPYLSMGMSRDYPIAVEEGANLVRIGSAIFQKQS